MRIIVTGGGTGGHIYPAIAIAQKFQKENPDCEVLYVGSEHGMEKDLVPRMGYNIKLVDAKGINRTNPLKLAETIHHTNRGIIQSSKILKEFKPDYIIGTGGYACFPTIFTGARMGIPCYLHEQNAFPGVANRSLERYVKKVFLGFDDARKYFRDEKKIIYAGNPVRETFFNLTREEARKNLGISEDEIVILSFGGSLGAETINNTAFELMKRLNGKEHYRLIFGTGVRYKEIIDAKIKNDGVEIQSNIEVKDYINNMDNYLMASDLVIERSGALSVAETTVCGKPSVLIPSPNVTANHQYFNAKAVADRGGAILVEEKDLVVIDLVDQIISLLRNKKKLTEMGECAKECAPMEALDIIYKEITR